MTVHPCAVPLAPIRDHPDGGEMRMLVLVLLGVLASRAAAAPLPVRVTIECEGDSRTKACPAFLLGFVDANKVLLSSPRSAADVIVYATATQVASIDKLRLRFVSKLAGAPPVIELDVDVDSRATDDVQRAQLEPVFLRGIALFVAARHPAVVTVTLGAPDAATATAPATSPWGVALNMNGFINYTRQFQSYNASSGLELSRLDRRSRAQASVFANGGLDRQPPLSIEDDMGNVIGEASLDTSRWSLGGQLLGAWLYNRCYSVGAATGISRDDPKGQFRYAANARLGIEWDRYQADDPRGNRLAVAYIAGYQVERYNVRNEIGERFAQFPTHAAVASASVRKDKIGIGVSLRIQSEMFHPMRRHNITATPFVELKLGDHVDVGLTLDVTKRELPGPDPDEIDPTDFSQVSRLAFAEPFSFTGFLSLTIHFDRTNGARNDRLTDL